MAILNKKHHFKIFKEECNYWLDRLNLKDWRTTYDFDNDYDTWSADSRAEVNGGSEDRIAIIWLNKNWPEDELDEFNIRETAFHEVLELRLAGLRKMAKTPHIIDDELINEEIHKIIRVLESSFFIDNLKRRKIKVQNPYT